MSAHVRPSSSKPAIRLAAVVLLTAATAACSSDPRPCGDGTFSAACVAVNKAPAGDVTGAIGTRPPLASRPATVESRSMPHMAAVAPSPRRPALKSAKPAPNRYVCAPTGRVSVRLRPPPQRVYSDAGDITGALSRPTSRAARPGFTPVASNWGWEGGSAVTVGPGDTIPVLSRRYGVPVAAIIQTNGLSARSEVRAGDRIVIPRYNYLPGPAVSAPETRPAAAPHSGV